MSNEKRIEVRNLFMQYGIKSLTMDDIARHLRISKKTLYEFVKDKNDLVQQCIQSFIDEACCEIEENKENTARNAIDELLSTSAFMINRMGDFHPSVMYDLEKFHPESLALIEAFKSEAIYNKLLNNLKKGVHEGLYRNNLNFEYILNIHFTVMDSIQKHQYRFEMQNNLSFKEAITEFLRYHVRGIASEKGLAYLSKTINHLSS